MNFILSELEAFEQRIRRLGQFCKVVAEADSLHGRKVGGGEIDWEFGIGRGKLLHLTG